MVFAIIIRTASIYAVELRISRSYLHSRWSLIAILLIECVKKSIRCRVSHLNATIATEIGDCSAKMGFSFSKRLFYYCANVALQLLAKKRKNRLLWFDLINYSYFNACDYRLLYRHTRVLDYHKKNKSMEMRYSFGMAPVMAKPKFNLT